MAHVKCGKSAKDGRRKGALDRLKEHIKKQHTDGEKKTHQAEIDRLSGVGE